ncbi:hypothetical protein SKB0092_38590 (plasmid) [Roseomonas mucosa]
MTLTSMKAKVSCQRSLTFGKTAPRSRSQGRGRRPCPWFPGFQAGGIASAGFRTVPASPPDSGTRALIA